MAVAVAVMAIVNSKLGMVGVNFVSEVCCSSMLGTGIDLHMGLSGEERVVWYDWIM